MSVQDTLCIVMLMLKVFEKSMLRNSDVNVESHKFLEKNDFRE